MSKPYTIIKFFLIFYIIFIFSFTLGGFLIFKQLWPYSIYLEIAGFLKGGDDEQTTLTQKVKNDMNVTPYRLLRNFNIDDKTNYKPVENIKFNSRRTPPLFFLSKDAPRGYRLLLGTFDFQDGLHGAILLDKEGHPIRKWNFSHDNVDWKHPKDTNIFPHGFDIADDGSMVLSFGGGGLVLSKYDFCGNVIWQKRGGFHHSVDIGDDDDVWAWGEENRAIRDAQVINKISLDSGEVIKRISIDDIFKANPDIDILEIRKSIGSVTNSKEEKKKNVFADPTHGNDIDVLSNVSEKLKNIFAEGDLLISLRNLNTIFVLDPNTLKIKWWRVGATRRQHDADWDNQDVITVFDNNTGREYSKIVAIDPQTFTFSTLLDGKDYQFYSEARGKHQLLPNGGLLVVSADQGRIFEVDSIGNVTFEFINRYDEAGQTLIVTDARFLPEEFFKELPKCD